MIPPLAGPLFLHVSNDTESEPPVGWVEGPAEAPAAPVFGGTMIVFVIAEIVLMLACDARLCYRHVRYRGYRNMRRGCRRM